MNNKNNTGTGHGTQKGSQPEYHKASSEAEAKTSPNRDGTPAPVIIKKYANRRLYDTSSSAYVTLDFLRELVREGVEFTVLDAKSGEDLTRQVLAQIIFEQESRGQTLLPVNFLRQLIRFYGDSVQSFVPGYLDMSLTNFTSAQEKWREQVQKSVSQTPAAMMMTPAALEEQVKRNMALYEQTMKAWTAMAVPGATNPFMPGALFGGGTGANADPSSMAATPLAAFTAMQQKMFEMQRQMVEMTERSMGTDRQKSETDKG
jgi:polyhydroxyalkanoate synthesis repressor PhaR